MYIGWWPRYHGGACSAVSVRLAQLLQELRALPEEEEAAAAEAEEEELVVEENFFVDDG